MTGTDFSRVGEVIARLSVHHGTQVISCRYGRCHVPRQSVSLHPTASLTAQPGVREGGGSTAAAAAADCSIAYFQIG